MRRDEDLREEEAYLLKSAVVWLEWGYREWGDISLSDVVPSPLEEGRGLSRGVFFLSREVYSFVSWLEEEEE